MKTKNESSPPRTIGRAGLAALDRLPSWVLKTAFGVLLVLTAADLLVADPLPVLDEAALLWALNETWKAIRRRRSMGLLPAPSSNGGTPSDPTARPEDKPEELATK